MPMKHSYPRKPGSWIRRRSELNGYGDSIYRTDRSGDYVRVDVAPSEDKIRLLVEDRGETIWCSVIEKGKVISEMADGRSDPDGVGRIFERKAPSFRTLPPELIRLIAGHYGITVPPRSKAAKRTPLISRVFLIALLLCLAFAAAFLFVRHLTGLF